MTITDSAVQISNKDSVIITSALPYANGEIHLGHISSTYLPADIFRRFLKLNEVDVYHLCASDDFGTPILIETEKKKTKPEIYVKHWHDKDIEDFKSVGIIFDSFSQTSSSTNREFVQYVFNVLSRRDLIYEKEVVQSFCEKDSKFLPDRYVVGTCPYCGAMGQYSDLCEKCGRIPEKILGPKCAICGLPPVKKNSNHYFFKLSNFDVSLEKWLSQNKFLQQDVKKYVLNWIVEGLQDWDITRDITWGINIPVEGNDKMDKVFYGWFDNHLCYISSFIELLGNVDVAREKWNKSKIYHFIGKDIVYHHYLFLPAIRLGIDQEYKLPDLIPTRGHLMLQNNKISKSRNWYIGLREFVNQFEADYLRFYIASICSYSQDDINFDWNDFEKKINNELIANIGNFVNRTLTFIKKYFDNTIPHPNEYDDNDKKVLEEIKNIGNKVADFILRNEIDKALKCILNFSSLLNQYFQKKEPWKNPKQSATSLFVSINAVRSLSILLEPFIPFSAEKIWQQISLEGNAHEQKWNAIGSITLKAGHILGNIQPLFKKIDEVKIKEQVNKLNNR
ncbi:MAG TPA: methionine--tRNA ligase [Nitrososphaeraceae archaeon]|nr:methionine--tRNA ligase [Nitrososphaeraceae archaeon]